MHAESGISGRHKMKAWKAAVGASGVLLTCASAPAFALGFDLFDGDVIGHFNTTASIGAAIRTESQSPNLLGKGNLSPTGCSRAYQTRSDARRVGNECFRTCKPRWPPPHKKKKTQKNTK